MTIATQDGVLAAFTTAWAWVKRDRDVAIVVTERCGALEFAIRNIQYVVDNVWCRGSIAMDGARGGCVVFGCGGASTRDRMTERSYRTLRIPDDAASHCNAQALRRFSCNCFRVQKSVDPNPHAEMSIGSVPGCW